MMRLFAVPVGVLGLVTATVLQHQPSFAHMRADPCAILVTYLAFRFDLIGGVFSAMILGLLLDVSSGAPVGLHMLSLQVLFVLMRILANAVQGMKPGVRLLPVAAGAALVHAGLVSLMLGLFAGGAVRLAGVWQSSLPSVVANLVLGLPLLFGVDRLAQKVMPDSDHMFLPR